MLIMSNKYSSNIKGTQSVFFFQIKKKLEILVSQEMKKDSYDPCQILQLKVFRLEDITF